MPISVEEKAVQCSSSPVFFARADAEVSPDRGWGRVIDNELDKSAPSTIRVGAISVDEYVGKAEGPDFIKGDVEGAEVEVFRGANAAKGSANLGYHCEKCRKNHILAQHAT